MRKPTPDQVKQFITTAVMARGDLFHPELPLRLPRKEKKRCRNVVRNWFARVLHENGSIRRAKLPRRVTLLVWRHAILRVERDLQNSAMAEQYDDALNAVLQEGDSTVLGRTQQAVVTEASNANG